jgi:transcriptional regulator with XRE-family HTH domain
MKNTKFVSNKLRFYREQAGLTQKAVAEALGLDCTDRISRWENSIAMPSVANLFRLAEIYKVMPHELYPELGDLDEARMLEKKACRLAALI